MAAKSKTFAIKGGGHTAGIFADMTVDGPVIGTLVAVVDRAKNLPNRKTIGKQDPYCAARLGKEAKKTTTDIRGGQTPKWDQELRFTVHDSPDYYQLKMSIFTDDKKTDLIGEAWIDLKGIIVSGGGQSDMWQGLTCRGKYAGEIRVEITFYDSRPRPERPPARQRQQAATAAELDVGGSLKQSTPVKRRPLPSDPVTGEAPVTPPVAVPVPQEQLHTPRSHARSASHSAHVTTQSPLQAVEYNTPPRGARPPTERHPYTPSPHSAHRHENRARESYGTSSRYQDERGYGEKAHACPYDQQEPRGSHVSFPDVYELPDDSVSPSSFDNGTPPPPPAHRSKQNSAGPDATHHYDTSPQKSPMQMRQDVLKSDAHRHSAPSYPGQPVFKPYDAPTPAPMQIAPRHASQYDSPSSQRLSRSPGYSPSYSPHHRSMQPTVEDVPDSPSATYKQNGSFIAASKDEAGYHPSPGTSSQIVSRSPGASGQYYGGQSPLYDPREQPDDTGYPSSVSPLNALDYQNTSSQSSYNSEPSQHVPPSRRSEVELSRPQRSSSYLPPAIPPSLSPGTDLASSQESSDRSYNDQRYNDWYSAAHHATPTRGRHHSEGPPSYTNSPHSYVQQQPYDGRSVVTYSSRPAQQGARPRNSPSPSPNPQHAIRRKSVSPAPPSAQNKRLSDVPFSPDSYDAFNTSMTASASGAVAARTEKMDPKTKIIGYDGREVDPSDYLPMETWAPEPEVRGKSKQASPEARARPSPSGAQPMPPSGRRPLRIVARPDSMPAQKRPSAPPAYGQTDDMRTPPASGRNRLQKKAARDSTGYSGHSASTSSPLAPISPDNHQERHFQYTHTRSPLRGSSDDYPSENYAPQYGAGPPIPAKVPLPIMSGANGGVDMALMEEMQRIDIGAGRSRRRGGY